MKRYLLFFLLLAALRGFAQLSAPVVAVQDIYKTTLTVSWTKPVGATGFVLQRATASDFSGATEVYSGAQQLYYETGLTQATTYYYRVKATQGVTESSWASLSVKTFAQYTAASQGGNRLATASDVANTALNPDGHLVEGDYLIVGTIGGGYTPSTGNPDPWGGTVFGTDAAELGITASVGFLVPELSSTAKIYIVGGRGWDYISLNLRKNPRPPDNPLIITNGGGQVRGRLWLTHAQNVLVSGRYDPVKKTGSPDYLGWDGPWERRYGSFGFQCEGTWGDRAANIVAISGESKGVKLEYMQIGRGSFASLVVKSDAQTLTSMAVGATGGASSFVSNTAAVIVNDSTERIRLTATTVSTSRIDYVEFTGTGALAGLTFTVQAEDFDASNGATNNGTDVQLVTSSTASPAYIDLPIALTKGTYNMNIRAATAAGVTLQVKAAAIPIDSVEVRYCYFADGGSEGLYGGSTQTAPQQRMKNFYFHDCIFARLGTNPFQLGNLTEGGLVENCVFVMGAFEWSNTFQRFQDQTVQFGARKNGFVFRKNICAGGGENFLNVIMAPAPYDVGYSVSDVARIDSNLFTNVRGYHGGFISPQVGFDGTLQLKGNYWRGMGNGSYEVLYDQQLPRNYVLWVQSVTSGKVTLNVSGNTYDESIVAGGSFAQKQSETADLTINDDGSNTRSAAVAAPRFKNVMDLAQGFDYASVERWTATYQPDWNASNRDNTAFETAATAQGIAITEVVLDRVYNTGDMVRWQGVFYRSLTDNNTGNEPTGFTDANWEVVVFSNGALTPIDDVRLYSDDPYAQLGMGLTAQYDPSVGSWRIPKGRRIRFIKP